MDMFDGFHGFPGGPLTVSMMSTYPPTACGLATFASALERAMVDLGHRVRFVRVDDGTLESDGGHRTAGHLLAGSLPSVRRAAHVLSDADVAIVQHEYGIYGGRDGEEVLDVLRLTDVPLITVLHTVPTAPTPNQRRILEELGRLSSQLVVLTASARDRLVDGYLVDPHSVVVIPHGAIVVDRFRGSRLMPTAPRPQLLSWGLIGPGKGLESVIDAVGDLETDGHPVDYTIAGRTHPKVARLQGESYRGSLVRRARDRGVLRRVHFDQSYRGPEHLAHYIASSSVVVLPYTSTDQIVSGVLVDSIAAGRPVISTAFPHARELLADGGGILVDHGDHDGLVEAIRAVTRDPGLLARLTSEAQRLAPLHSWPSVGHRYAQLAAQLSSRLEPIPA
jgi:glycosyltransferase involved in cell wall biosynthesis